MSISYYPKTELEPYYFLCGMCSNIPKCCIDFYAHYIEVIQYHKQEDILKFVKGINLHGFRYIPCETCHDSLRPNIINKCKDSSCILPPNLRIYNYQPEGE
jgi:hypothetical protein